MRKFRLASFFLLFFVSTCSLVTASPGPFLFPRIGVANSVSAPVLQANGSYNVTYTINVKNYGDEKLTGVQVTDALGLVFIAPSTFTLSGAVVATGSLISNTNFNGVLDTNLLAAGSFLNAGSQGTIVFTINVVTNGSFGPFVSLIVAGGTGTLLPVLDSSVDGTNPDPNGDGSPIETSPTTVSLIPFPIIGVAKSAASPQVQSNGSYNIPFTITISNLGNEILTNVQVTDALVSTFIAPSTYTVSNVVSTGTLVANAGFNGNGNTNLLAAGSTLGLGATQTITFTANVVTNGLFGPFLNLATASGKGSTLTTTDLSVDGNNPDPNGDHLPLETLPTSISLIPTPIIGVAKSASAPLAQADGSNNVTFTITVKNLGNEVLHNVQVTDALISAFIGPSVYALVGGVVSSGTLSANAGFNGNANTNLLAAGSTLAVGVTQTITFTVNVKPNGLLGPFANTAIATASGSLLPTTDVSVDGNNPDPNGDGLPLEVFPTVVSLLPVPIIGVAKSAGSPAVQVDGSYNVPFTITIKNLGNEVLNNVQVTDALISTFVAPSAFSIVGNVLTSGSLVANVGFNGNLSTTLLQPGSSLAVGATQTINFTVNVHPNGLFGLVANTAIATATGSILPTTDISVDGNNPDPNGDGLPLETLPTIINLIPIPVIGIAKSATSPQLQANGTYNVTFTLTVENLGNEALHNVQVTDALISAFIGGSTYSLVGGIVASGSLIANSSFNGNGITNLLAAGSTLAVGATQTVVFTVNVKPNTAFGPFLNTAIATANGSLLPTTDISVDGNNPDPNGDGLPLETLPTIVNLIPLPLIGLSKNASTPLIQPNGSYNLTYTFTVQNMGNEPLTNVQITDNMVSAFVGPAVYSIVGNVVSSGTLTANLGFNGNLSDKLLAPGSTLAVGASQTVSVTVNVVPGAIFGPFLNTALATANGSLLPTSDLSMDGNNPDPNGDGLPLETLPTLVLLVPVPVIGIAKSATAPLLQPDGSYSVIFTITLENLGNEKLFSVQATDLLLSAFPAPAGFTLVGPPVATGSLIANAAYNGNLIGNLLAPGSTLDVGDKQTVSFTLNVRPNTLFGPFVNTAVATALGSLLPTADISVDGNNPDPNGDGIPLELSPTTVILIPAPSIGVAKNIINTILQPNGSYNVTYGITLKNYGNVELHNITVVDDLSLAFGLSAGFSLSASVSTTGGIEANLSFNGLLNTNLINPANSVLGIGESETITYTVNIKPGGIFGPFCNSAIASATGPLGIGLTIDVSESGTNPDPNGNGNPTEENSCTQLRLASNPVIGVAKSAGVPTSLANGSYNVQYTITVSNLGNTALADVQVTDDLSQALPGVVFFVQGSPSSTGTLTTNTNFNGLVDKNLLAAGSTLAVGATATISFNVNIIPNGLFFGPFFNSAIGSGRDASGTATTNDISTDGTNPDPNGNGNPGDADESIPTPFSLTPNPVIGIAKAASSPVLQANGSYNITLTFTVQNLGNVVLNNVKVTDNLTSVFPSPSTFSIVGAVTSPVSLIPNPGYDGNTDINLISAGSTLPIGATEHITVSINVAPNGSFGPFFNTSTASATAAGFSTTTSDVSTDGNNPDPNNNHNPSDPGEDVSTTISLSPNPIIGVAKAVTSSLLQADGSYVVTFSITVKNYGNVQLNNVVVTDDLSSAFSTPTTFTISQGVSATGGLIPNTSYTGKSDINLLAAGNSLAVGSSQTITFSANVAVNGNFGPYYNSAKATGTGASGSGNTTDISASGTNPDPNGNGNPGDAGENDATPISLTPNAVMGVAKAASIPQLLSDGSYKVTYTVIAKNLGNVPFSNVQVTDNLASTFSAPTTFSVSGIVAISGSASPNASFNGTTDINLLAAGNTLPIGSTVSITFQVIIQPGGNFGPFYNSAVGTATSPAGNYSDISASGTNPDPNGNGNPGDPGENNPTAITLTPQPILGVAKAAANPILQADGSYRITYTITLKNMGNVSLSNVQVTDDLKNAFVAPATFSLVGNVTSTGLLSANPLYDGSTDTNLLSAGSIANGSTQTISFTVAVLPNGSFGPFYNSAVGKGSSGAVTYTDISNSGNNPDPNGNGNPGDPGEDTATPVSLAPVIVAGIAKAASLPLPQPDGTYKVTYTLTVENLGNSNINNIQIKDYLTSAFPAPATFSVLPGSATTGALIINPTFNGSTDVNLLASGSKLAIGATHTLTFTVSINLHGSSGIFYNRSTVTVTSDDTLTTYTDISSNGTNPDPNGNGNPGDPGENDPTPVTLTPHAVIGIAKSAGLPLQQADGSFNVVYAITIQNMGNVMLSQIQVKDDIRQAFPSPLTFSVSNVTTAGTMVVNTAFNGNSDTNLLGVGNTLGIGASTVINFTANIKANGDQGTFYNSATGSATGNGGTSATTDVSVNGNNPDPNGNGDPGDSGEDAPTPVTLILSPVIGLAKSATIPLMNSDGSFDLTFTIVVENLGNVALSNISVYDDVSLALTSPITFSLTNVQATGSLVINPAYDGKSGINLLLPTSTLGIGGKELITFNVNVAAPVGAGPYYNSALSFASNPDNSLTYADISTQGLDPDPNGNGNPNDPNESQPTSFLLQLTPIIALANEASPPVLQADGTYNIDFSLIVANLGNEDLGNIVITNDLSNTFPPSIGFKITKSPTNQGALVANSQYDGSTQSQLVTSGTMAIAERKTLTFSINVSTKTDFGLFWNSAHATATGKSSARSTTDISDNGVNPDANGNGVPDYVGENDATPINLIPNLVLGLAKSVSTPVSTGNCVYDATYVIGIKNYGNSVVRHVDLMDSLAQVFPDPVQFSVASVVGSSGLHINPSYNGASDPHLLTKADTLSPGQTESVTLQLHITPNGNYGPYLNSAFGSSVGPLGESLTDLSASGDLPPDLVHNPNDNIPTPLTIEPANLFFPEAFSPNGDGQHDLYEISLSCGMSANLIIFNRYGDKVFNADNYQNDWNGFSNHGSLLGRPLPDGTYFYTIELSNGKKYTSFVIVKR